MNGTSQCLNSFEREFDLIVLGASGFTGQFVVDEVTRTAANDPIKWAISGRSAQKLAVVLSNVTKETGIDVKHIPIIEADIRDQKSLRAMTARTRLVLNCVGPYSFYGEQVVSSCVDTATNHLDISGEPMYMESIQLKYHKTAQAKGIYIILCCGGDTFPLDIGIRFLKKKFDGELNSVESYHTFNTGPQGFTVSYGSWLSKINKFAMAKQLAEVKLRLHTEFYAKAPCSKYELKANVFPFKTEYAKGWCLPLFIIDSSVLKRTELFRYEVLNERPIQIETYITNPGLLPLLIMLLVWTIFGMLARFEWGVSMMKAHPKLFSLGNFSKEGPTHQQMTSNTFVTTIVGKGWAEKLTGPSDEPTFAPNKTVVIEVRGNDPYKTSSTCLVQSGFTLLHEFNKLPQKGGVLTAGSAFADTDIVSRLREYGVAID